MSFLEKTSMSCIKICQAVEYNVTDFIPSSPVTEYFLNISRFIIVFTIVLSHHIEIAIFTNFITQTAHISATQVMFSTRTRFG